MKIKIQYDGGKFEINVADGAGVDDALEFISEHPFFKKAVEDMLAGHSVTVYGHDHTGISKEFTESIMQAFLSGGHEDLERYLSEESYRTNTNVGSYVSRCVESSAKYRSLLSGIVRGLEQFFHHDIVKWEAGRTLYSLCCEHLEERDPSKPLDVIPPDAEVDVCYAPELRWVTPDDHVIDIDDLYMAPTGSSRSMSSVVPDASFERFLRFLNVGSESYKLIAKHFREVDLDSDPEHGQAWSDLKVPSDETKPCPVTTFALVDMMDKATRGGVPVLVCRVKLRDFIERDWSQPFNVAGGYVGIHNFAEGQGYMVANNGPGITVPAYSGWMLASAKEHSPESVYVLKPEVLQTEIKPFVPLPPKPPLDDVA